MKFRYVVRALGASAVFVALTAGVLDLAEARLSNVSDAQTYQLFSPEQLSQCLAPCRYLSPGNVPLNLDDFTTERRATDLCFDHFANIHSAQSKTPIVTVERLNRSAIQNARFEERTNASFPNPRLKAAYRASLDDYRGSGYDRGHNAPASDQASPRGMAQCFSLAGMSPQSPRKNRGVWSKVESDVREYDLRAPGDGFVYTGPLFVNRPVATVGKGRVWVPSHLFKLVYDETKHRSWAYILSNTDDARMSPPVSYEAFVRATGYQFLRGLPLVG